jgi:ABC-type polysaccharide/polyol phosphate transport system ATPase subunit
LCETPAIVFDRVCKDYRLARTGHRGLKQVVLDRLRGRPISYRAFRALDEVSFEVRRGECFGLVGPNGSGKSTALSLMAGVLETTSGAVRTHGRICPLLELGAGFHHELTGRENILLNGVLLGMTAREVRHKIDAIIDFSGLGEFIEQQVRTYSSGMVARLGFSVAAHLDPDVLLVDEVLSVGDAAFSEKCRDKFEQFRKEGVTIVLVTHAHGLVMEMCDRAVLLHKGKVQAFGEATPVVQHYMGLLNERKVMAG